MFFSFKALLEIVVRASHYYVVAQLTNLRYHYCMEENQSNNTAHAAYNAKKSSAAGAGKVLICLVLLALLGLCGFTTYNSLMLSNKIQTMESDVTTLKAAQASQSTAPANDQPTNSLSVDFGSAQHYWEYFGAPLSKDTSDLLLVNVTIKNTGKSSAKFERSKLTLKDKSDMTYPLATESSLPGSDNRFKSGIIGLPNGQSELQDQDIPAGETVKGLIVFYTPQELHDYKISYDGDEQTIVAKPGEYKYLQSLNN